MALSKENYDKVIHGGIYKADYKDFTNKDYESAHWCRNWTFRPVIYPDSIYMADTYFGEFAYQLTDENFNKFEFVVIESDIVHVSSEQWDTIDEKDRFHMPLDSGGWSGRTCWVKKESRASKEKLLQQKEEALRIAKRKVEWLEGDIERIKQGTSCELNPIN
jgi:hypothetical protein